MIPVGPDGIWFTEDDGLRLQASSPAIDAGYDLPNDSLKYDMAGLMFVDKVHQLILVLMNLETLKL